MQLLDPPPLFSNKVSSADPDYDDKDARIARAKNKLKDARIAKIKNESKVENYDGCILWMDLSKLQKLLEVWKMNNCGTRRDH